MLFLLGVVIQEARTKTLILSFFDYGVVLILGLALFSFATGRNVHQWLRQQPVSRTNPVFDELSDLPPIPAGGSFFKPNPLAVMAPSKMTMEERFFWNPRLRYVSEGELMRTKRPVKKAASNAHRTSAGAPNLARAKTDEVSNSNSKSAHKSAKRKNWRSDPINMVY